MRTTYYFIALSLFLISACDAPQSVENHQANTPETNATSFKPGFGMFMGYMQKFHEKLGLAGNNENWELANFYLHELEETVEDIEEMHPDRNETLLLSQMLPSQIELVEDAVEEKDLATFKEAYIQLTATCNSCHASTGYEFIEIQVPDKSSYPSQLFKKKQ